MKTTHYFGQYMQSCLLLKVNTIPNYLAFVFLLYKNGAFIYTDIHEGNYM